MDLIADHIRHRFGTLEVLDVFPPKTGKRRPIRREMD